MENAHFIMVKNLENQKLSNSCRACLSCSEDMKFLLDNSEETNNLLAKFVSTTNLEIEFNNIYPSFICKSCEEKITSFFEFQEQCKQSNDFIYQYRAVLENKNFVNNESNVTCDIKEDDDISKIDNNEAIIEECIGPPKELPKRNQANQKMRLKQYDVQDVEKAIKIVRGRLNRHTVCIFCQFKATSSRTLSVHVSRMHRDYKGTWCIHCNDIFTDLPLHSKDVHWEDLKCQFCSKISKNMGHYMEHMASHSGTRIHKCTLCEMSFISKRHLEVHQKKHNLDNGPLSCKICKLQFFEQKGLKEHIDMDHKSDEKSEDNNGGHKISILDSPNVQVDDFDKITSEPQNYCNKCNKKVRSLKYHNNRYHSVQSLLEKDVKRNLCPHCGKQFRTISKLTVHIRTHTGECPYKCQYCGKKMRTRNILKMHERTHTGEKPYSCTVCGKSFAQTSCLNTHLKIHNGRPVQCTICDKRFCRAAELKIHLRNHTGEKPYACEFCNQKFKQKSHLVEHIKRHSDDRPYKCNYCEKAFKSVGTLKCHLQIHTGEKPFKCSQCPYACRQPYSLTQHMQQHRNDRPRADHPHTCEICQRSFITVAHLTTHYNRLHSHLNIKSTKSFVPDQSDIEVASSVTVNFPEDNIEFLGQTPQVVIESSSQEIGNTVALHDNLHQQAIFEFPVINQ